MQKEKSNKTFRVTKIELDSNGQLPTRFMLIQSGNWPNSVKGNFEITPDDLREVKENFDKGIGFPTVDASTGLAIDFKHEYDDQAAGWIKGLELDTTDPKTTKLYASPVEWSDAGAEAITSGQFKCVSPSGWFGRMNKRLSMWPNPQNTKEKVANVLDGAGLTNIPFLRGMSPIRASVNDNLDNENHYDKVIFISNIKQTTKEKRMTLDEVKSKEADQLSADEKKFLLDHADELTNDERNKFAIKFTLDSEEENEADESKVSEEDQKLLADIKSGSKIVTDPSEDSAVKEQLTKLEATAKKYETEKAEAIVTAHVKRGAIKQDSADFWTKSLLSATDDNRTELEDQLKALPSNELLSKEIGSAEDTIAGNTAREQLHSLANKKMEAAQKDKKELSYSEALKEVYREHPDLQKLDLAEQGVK